METARIVRCLSNNVNDPGRRAGKEHDVLCGDSARESLSFLDESIARLQPRALGRRRAHTPILIRINDVLVLTAVPPTLSQKPRNTRASEKDPDANSHDTRRNLKTIEQFTGDVVRCCHRQRQQR